MIPSHRRSATLHPLPNRLRPIARRHDLHRRHSPVEFNADQPAAFHTAKTHRHNDDRNAGSAAVDTAPSHRGTTATRGFRRNCKTTTILPSWPPNEFFP